MHRARPWVSARTHAWVAWRLGDPTAYLSGQVSLSPWPHVRRSPIGMLIIPVLTSLTQGWTMGWASAPYDPAWADRHPRRAALMALAGPLGNLVIALAVFGMLRLGLAIGVFEAPHAIGVQHLVANALPADRLMLGDFFAVGLSVLLALNVLLLIFNLLPFPPLDGASVVALVLPLSASRSLRRAIATPGLSIMGIVAAWQVFPACAKPILGVLAALLYPGAR